MASGSTILEPNQILESGQFPHGSWVPQTKLRVTTPSLIQIALRCKDTTTERCNVGEGVNDGRANLWSPLLLGIILDSILDVPGSLAKGVSRSRHLRDFSGLHLHLLNLLRSSVTRLAHEHPEQRA